MNRMKKVLILLFALVILVSIIIILFIKKENIPISDQIASKRIIKDNDYSVMGDSYTSKIFEKYDTVLFGMQKSDSIGIFKQPIEWIILAKEKNKALLMTKYVIDCKAFDFVDIENLNRIDDSVKDNYKNIAWETCSLRKWLNEEFVKNSFTHDEIDNILDTTLEDTKTVDKVFCLSEVEYKKFFDNGGYYERNRNIGDSHIYYNGATIRNKNALNSDKYKMIEEDATYDYWLRDKDINTREYGVLFGTTKVINYFGDVMSSVNYDFYCGVRPAMWVALE